MAKPETLEEIQRNHKLVSEIRFCPRCKTYVEHLQFIPQPADTLIVRKALTPWWRCLCCLEAFIKNG